MDKSPAHHLDEITSSLSLDELTPFHSNSGTDYVQTSTSLQIQVQPFLYDPALYPQQQQQQQQFIMPYSPISTHPLYPLNVSQAQPWPTPSQQQSYLTMTSSSLPEGTMHTSLSASSALPEGTMQTTLSTSPAIPEGTVHTTLSATSTSPIRREYVPLAKRPSMAGSTHSTPNDNDSPSTTREIRRERRRAQNRAAQRAFRARKEETIKESSTRLSALRAELFSLQSSNSALTSAVDTLRARIGTLQRENTQLRRNSIDAAEWASFDLIAESPGFVRSALESEESHGSSNSRTQIGSLEGGSDDENAGGNSRGWPRHDGGWPSLSHRGRGLDASNPTR